MSGIKELRIKHQNLKDNLESNVKSFCKLLGFEIFSFRDNEIDNIQMFYLNTFKEPQKFNLSITELRELFFAYCFEAFINSNGGDLILDDKKRSISYGKSIIVKYGGSDYPWVGISIDAWIKRLEEGRFKGKLSEAINRNLIKQNL